MQEKGDDWYFKDEWLDKAIAYDLKFYRSGGLLTAGPDPSLHNLPGFGDQLNYTMLEKAGFQPHEAIQVMTGNGAKLLGLEKTGSIQEGYKADLVVLKGDLNADPEVIKNVETVIKSGMAYDPELLIESVRGKVGSTNDDYMSYFGQKAPGDKPEIFAPNLISFPDRVEFGSVFSKDGKEFYYAVEEDGVASIYESKLRNGVWSPPSVVIEDEVYSFNDPMLSNDESRLYFIINMPGKEGMKDYDIMYVER
ncbi:amidohydrolase family protein [Gramella sp. KN1008]|uniref:amidohydrolase family protein n=1 Tax=Gramella sp. KN1008 TaxID=2529298 RepID=UPI00103F9B32|nr:amidohydrolase family protein [Gramella sp. KN1008]TBW26541.1 hypothetical protein EZJ28_14150 [Gramella sp. KN1008]